MGLVVVAVVIVVVGVGVQLEIKAQFWLASPKIVHTWQLDIVVAMALAVITAVDVGRAVYVHSLPDALSCGKVELEHSQYADMPESGSAP